MTPSRPSSWKPPSVLFLATDLSTGGGVNRVIRDLAVLFARRLQTNVRVVSARSDRESAYAFPADLPVQFHRGRSLLAYFRLLLKLRMTRPDFVVSSWTQDNILVTLALLFSRTRVIAVEHSSWHFHRLPIRALRWLVYRLTWQVAVLNEADLLHYRRFLKNVRLIPNPVSRPEPQPTDHQREKLILAVGHLEPLKQFDHALRAMAQSRLEDDGWSLVVIGSGSEEEHLRALNGQLGLKRTRIVTDRQDLGPWYERASILLIASRLESFSLVLAEAMQAGVVPLAYASDGPSTILKPFPDQLVPVGDLESLTDKLRALATSADPGGLGQALAASVRERFSPDVVIAQWRELLSD